MSKKPKEPGSKNISIPIGYRRGTPPQYSAQPKGGEKRQRGQGICYENETKKPFNASLTPTVIEILKALALENNISRSEVIEQTFRGRLKTDGEQQFSLSLERESFAKLTCLATKANLNLTDFLAKLIADQFCYDMLLNLAKRIKSNDS